MKRIAVIGNPGGWSSERLADAVARRTGWRALVDASRLTLDLERGAVLAGDLDLCELDALIVKKVGVQYSVQHLNRLELLRYVDESGVPVFSRPSAIAGLLSRLSCTATLAAAGIPMPPTVVTAEESTAYEAVQRFGTVVLKPFFSSKARGMRLVERGPGALAAIREFRCEGNQMFYIQKLLELPERDLRIAFLGGEYLATYARQRMFDHGRAPMGAIERYEGFTPELQVIELAHRAQALFGLDFTCVDVALAPDGPVVFEVSAFGGFRGLLEGCGVDAAELYADYVLRRLSDV